MTGFLPKSFNIFLLVLFALTAYAGNLRSEPLWLGIHSVSDLSGSLEVLEDPQGNLTLDQVRQAELGGRFFQVNGTPNFGFTDSVYWARLPLKNGQDSPSDWRLVFAYPLIDDLQVYFVGPEGIQFQAHTGDARPFKERPLPHHQFVFPLHLAPNESIVVYLRVQSRDTLEIPLSLQLPEDFYRDDRIEQLGMGLYFGMVLVMALFNSILFLLNRERIYLYYVAYVVSFSLVVATLTGYAFEYFWPDWPQWNKLARPLNVGLTIVFVGAFIKSLMGDERSWLDRLLGWVIGLGGTVVLLSLLGPFSWAIQGSVLLSIPAAAVAFGVGLQRFWQGNRAARFYLAGWSLFLLGIVLYSLKAMGLLPPVFLVRHGMLFGSGLEILLLSLAIADRFNGTRLRLLESEQEKTAAQRELIAQLKETDRARGEFLNNMSHELRTPLNGIIGVAEALQGTGLDPEQDELLQILSQSSHGLLDIICDILDLSAVQKGRMPTNQAPFSLTEALEQSIALFTPAALEKGIELKFEVAETLPKHLNGDLRHLQQVLGNLLSNAIKFSNHGPVELMVSGEFAVENHWKLLFKVSDRGIGIAPEKISGLFTPFNQADLSTRKSFGGAGLGLTLASQLAELMGGRLWLESQLGKGTQAYFEVTLESLEDSYQVPIFAQHELDESTRLPKVLVAEDDRISRKILLSYLSRHRLDIQSCTTGQEALHLCSRQTFDLLLIDCSMPVMDGLVASEAIRALPGQKELIIIMMRNPKTDPPVSQCQESGANDLLSKPVRLEPLEMALLDWLGDRFALGTGSTGLTAPEQEV
ncbi:MAG: 7TM diverse intracellular signaling domain-containing protein [bacterium]|nr:7TM diverse intracellular signaling domain-containing protein [bacterium]